MADPLHLYYAPDLASNLFQFFEDSQQILGKYNLIVQGGFFNWSALKMTKCQTHWKI